VAPEDTAWGSPGSRPPPHRATLDARRRQGGGGRHCGRRRCVVADVEEMPGVPASAVARSSGLRRGQEKRVGRQGAGGEDGR
jgi:hypothetical protein